jgi:hypothetical protein
VRPASPAPAWLAALAILLILSACGGGGGGGGGGGEPPLAALTPFPTASQDDLPTGTRIDVSAENLFPSAAGDEWTYNQVQADGSLGPVVQQRVTSGPDASGRVVIVTDDVTGPRADEYIVDADGVLDPAPLGEGAPPGAAAIVGAIRIYAAPLYLSTRRHIRSGPWGEDLDGDGKEESFRFEFSQEFLGFNWLQVSTASNLGNVAHFRNVYRTTYRPTRAGLSDYWVEIREETWFAPGLGQVRAVISIHWVLRSVRRIPSC